MAEEIKEVAVAETPSQSPTSAPKAKAKSEKITLTLNGASSCHIDGFTLRKGQNLIIDSVKAERFLATGLFVKS